MKAGPIGTEPDGDGNELGGETGMCRDTAAIASHLNVLVISPERQG